MNSSAISQFVTLWLIVNVAAVLVLVVMSFFGSFFVLDWLELLDRWIYKLEHKHALGEESPKTGLTRR